MPAILIVDDEPAFLSSLQRMLRIEGHGDVTAVEDPFRVPPMLGRRSFDVAFLDVTMPGMDGLELLARIQEQSPATACVMVTAVESVPTVVKAMRLGAFDYLVKPLHPDAVTRALDKALEHRRLVDHLFRATEPRDDGLDDPAAFADVLTADGAMLRLLHEAELHARSSIPVLIAGETGSGKERLAMAVHRASPRAGGPFVPVNMLALSVTLFESEFFGHARGAFTGAVADKAGYLKQARGGTLFLDEIGDLPMEVQGKLLRILQEGEFTPVGSTQAQRADVRFVAATNQDLEAAVAEGRFRRDLYYRLRFARLRVPPLRERPDDVLLLAGHFLKGSSRPAARLADESVGALLAHEWPGNVRELKGTIEAAANLAEGGVLLPRHLGLAPSGAGLPAASEAVGEAVRGLEPLGEVERRHILAVYDAVARNKTRAARVLGVGLQTLHRKLKAYGVP